jgi:hypothetical protein
LSSSNKIAAVCRYSDIGRSIEKQLFYCDPFALPAFIAFLLMVKNPENEDTVG